MKIVVIAQYFPPDLGGSATRAYNIAKGLTLNGCEVTVVAAFPHYPHGRIPEEYRWWPLKVEWMDSFRVIRTFMPPIKSEGIFKRLVLIWAFAISSLFALPIVGEVDAVWASSWIPGVIYGKMRRRPIALNVDDLTLEDLIDLEYVEDDTFVLKVAELVYKFFLVKADAVTSVSPDHVEILSQKYGVKLDRIHVVRGGVDLAMFNPSSLKNSRGEKFVVLYSGTFSVAYDFDQIFRAAKVVENDREIEFVVQGIGELLGAMRSRIRELDVRNVRIVDKLLSRQEVADLLGQADALILPLVEFKKPYRGMSSKLYEYQAAGKPIICCSRGLPKRYVEETRSGLTVYPGDYKALAKAVMELKENPGLAQAMGQNGRTYVSSEASIEAIGLKTKALLERLDSKRVSGR